MFVIRFENMSTWQQLAVTAVGVVLVLTAALLLTRFLRIVAEGTEDRGTRKRLVRLQGRAILGRALVRDFRSPVVIVVLKTLLVATWLISLLMIIALVAACLRGMGAGARGGSTSPDVTTGGPRPAPPSTGHNFPT